METNQKELKWLTNVPNVCGYLPEEDKLEPCAERGAKDWINSLRARGHRVEVQYAYINGKLDKYMFSVWSDFPAESVKMGVCYTGYKGYSSILPAIYDMPVVGLLII